MNRFALVGLIVLVGSVVAAPVPKAILKKGLTIPLEVGSRWEYSEPSQPEVIIDLREITAIEEKDGATFATQKLAGQVQVMRVNAEGYAIVSVSNREHLNPRFIIKNDMKEGDTWDWDAGGYIERRTVGKSETITVPAGEFDAIPLNYKMVINGQDSGSSHTVWYANAVGLVRVDSNQQVSYELRRFTRGEKK
jgi:hypothetical protein